MALWKLLLVLKISAKSNWKANFPPRSLKRETHPATFLPLLQVLRSLTWKQNQASPCLKYTNVNLSRTQKSMEPNSRLNWAMKGSVHAHGPNAWRSTSITQTDEHCPITKLLYSTHSPAAILINHITKIQIPLLDSGSWGSKDTALKFQTQAKAKHPMYSSWPTGKYWFPEESAGIWFKMKVTIKAQISNCILQLNVQYKLIVAGKHT